MNVVENSKFVNELIDVEVDFLSRLINGETVQTYSMAMSVFSGVDPAPSSMLVSQFLNQSTVNTRVQGGIAGNIYRLSVAARTSANNIYINRVLIAVLSDNAVVPSGI